ncbi:hypothetical protein ANCDUO_18411, partial [Ancylostoma duodenale]
PTTPFWTFSIEKVSSAWLPTTESTQSCTIRRCSARSANRTCRWRCRSTAVEWRMFWKSLSTCKICC